jgi:energy-coupling factor transport system permease protein
VSAAGRTPPLALLVVAAGLVAVLFSSDHPAVLAGGLAASVALLAVAPGPKRGVLVLGLLLAVPVALLNPFVAVEGDLILIAGPSLTVIDLEVTLEELLFGAAMAARLLAVVLLTAAVLRLVDSDRLQARAARVVPRSALTVALAARLVPLLRADAQSIAEAARLRGVAPAGRQAGALLLPLAASSLERGLDQAEAMVARGYGRPGRTALPERRLTVREWLAAAAGLPLLGLAAALLAGALPYAYYPVADGALEPAAVAAGLVVAAAGTAAARLVRP